MWVDVIVLLGGVAIYFAGRRHVQRGLTDGSFMLGFFGMLVGASLVLLSAFAIGTELGK